MPPSLTHWDQLDQLHRWYAELDAPDPRPHLVAFAGDRAILLIGLRPFPPGAYQGPLVEALALALPLGADRVSVALPGRAWSLDDPVPPVTADADLRQRVLTQVTVDGHGLDTPQAQMRLHPFQVAAPPDAGLVWQPSLDPGPGEGWIPDALAVLVAGRHRVADDVTVDGLERQAQRLVGLGHELLTPRDVLDPSTP